MSTLAQPNQVIMTFFNYNPSKTPTIYFITGMDCENKFIILILAKLMSFSSCQRNLYLIKTFKIKPILNWLIKWRGFEFLKYVSKYESKKPLMCLEIHRHIIYIWGKIISEGAITFFTRFFLHFRTILTWAI